MRLFQHRYICLFSIFLFAGITVFAQQPVLKKPVVKKPVASLYSFKTFENGIKLKIKGFKVKEAYLLFDDDTKVPANNTVELNQRVSMLIILDNGFVAENGMKFPGASEKIVLSNGYKVLETGDLFTAYDSTGVKPEDANFIILKAVITQLENMKNHVIVSFKVWDKKGPDEITGSYKLFIK